VVAVSGYEPATAHVTLDPVGVSGLCHRYPDRPPILALEGRRWTLTVSVGENPDPVDAEHAAQTLLRLAMAYAEDTHAWAERRRQFAACQSCGGRQPEVPA
jgi:hypothetical protein